MDLITVGIIVGGVLALFVSLAMFVTNNYIKVAPNKVAVVFGMNHKLKQDDGTTTTVGFRLIQGGGFFKIPFLERVEYLDLSTRQIEISVEDAPNVDGVMTTVQGIANVKFASAIELLRIAVERFLDKSTTQINEIIFQNLEGHLRSTVGQMTMEDLIRNKAKLNEAILSDANEDFEKMGIKIDFLNIADIKDKDNYIENMGRKRAAEIQRDADIGEAEAKRQTVMKTSTANREGVERDNENKAAIAESDRVRDVTKAQMKAETDKANEISNQAGPLSNAKAMQAVVEAQATTEAAQEKANILVETQRALKEEKKLYANTIVPAEAAKTALIVQAQGIKESAIIEADGQSQSVIKVAEGDAQSVKLRAIAEAEGEAASIQKTGEAEASAIRLKLLAEAEGIEAKAIAYEKLDQTGKFLEVLTSLQTLAPAVIREFAGVMGASTAHLANVDEIKIVDFGGGNGKDGGGTTLGNFGKVPTEIITKMMESASASGFDFGDLLSKIGISSTDVTKAVTAEMNTATDKPSAEQA
jgi:flotillin